LRAGFDAVVALRLVIEHSKEDFDSLDKTARPLLAPLSS
jgi:hypothetical protein